MGQLMTAIVTGHKNPDTDSVISAIAAADLYSRRGIPAQPAAQGAPAPETVFVLQKNGLAAPQIISTVNDRQIYLVDFSDLAQAPEDIKSAVIKGIVDHHKLGDITTDAPLEVWIWPVGCTCTVIKNMYDFYNVQIPRSIAGGMLCAILSDTVIFKSPTTTELDRQAVEDLAKIAQVTDPFKLAMEMFKVKSAVEGTPAADLLFRDYKDFDMNGNKVGIAQLEVIDLESLAEIKHELKKELHKAKSEGRHSVFLLLTDIMKEGSELLVATDEPEIVKKAFGVDLQGDAIWLPGIMSRKKQVVPNFQKAFK